MKTSVLIILFLSLTATGTAAQNLELCVGQNGLTGYCDPNGQVVIEYKYWDGLPFIDGHAAVRLEDKWGIINTSGIWMVEPRYDEVFNCENVIGTILVLEDGEWSFCNEYGIPLTRGYEVAFPWYEFELDGYLARFTENTWFSVIRKGKWGIVDVNDHVKIPFDYEFTRVLKENVDGEEKPVSLILKKKGKYAWQRLDAKAATGFEFDTFLGQYIDLLFFRTADQAAIVNSVSGERIPRGDRDFYTLVNTKDSVGLVNAHGEIIVPFLYQTVNLNKVTNYIVFGQFGQLGLCDLKGNKLLDPVYRDINDLGTTPPSVAVRNQDGQLAIYRIDGKVPQQITPFKYSSVTYNGDEIHVIVGNRPGTVTLAGKENWQ